MTEALPELGDVEAGLLHLFIRHTSASLTLNENASPDVRDDFEASSTGRCPRARAYWTHTPRVRTTCPRTSRRRCSASLSLPVSGGRLALGTWQGIYLCDAATAAARSLLATLHGE